jgi:aldehyde dehydrogenase (NAD+)
MTATTEDPSATVQGEVRMLIGSELVEAGPGAASTTSIRPPKRCWAGADGGAEDMDLAIGARKAFDETNWSHRPGVPPASASASSTTPSWPSRLFRSELVAEVGCPIAITYGPQLDAPLEDGLLWPAKTIDDFEWERQLPIGEAFGMRSWRKVVKEPAGVVGAIIPWNYPFEVTLQKLGQALATGNTMIVKPAPDTPWNATRIGRLIAEHRHPGRRRQRATTSDSAVAEQLVVDPRVDLISFTGSTSVGRHISDGRPDHEAVLPRARRKSPRSSRRPIWPRPSVGPPSSASTPARAAP